MWCTGSEPHLRNQADRVPTRIGGIFCYVLLGRNDITGHQYLFASGPHGSSLASVARGAGLPTGGAGVAMSFATTERRHSEQGRVLGAAAAVVDRRLAASPRGILGLVSDAPIWPRAGEPERWPGARWQWPAGQLPPPPSPKRPAGTWELPRWLVRWGSAWVVVVGLWVPVLSSLVSRQVVPLKK